MIRASAGTNDVEDPDHPQRIQRSESSRALRGRAREFRRVPTTSEARLWTAMRDRRFRGLKFRRQRSLGPFVADFYCVEHRLAIEVDGSIHADPEVRIHDMVRGEWLDGRWVRVMRIPAALVMSDLTRALEMIGEALDPHAKSLPTTVPTVIQTNTHAHA